MSKRQRRLYINTQLRCVRTYCVRVHPEMAEQDAAMLWVSLYAAMFCEWWKMNGWG